MPFRWRAILLAPLTLPLIVAGWMALDAADAHSRLAVFGIFFLIYSIVSYGATVCMLLPALFVVSRFTRLTAMRVAALGAVLGVLGYVPVTMIMYFSPGMETRQPTDSYWKFVSTDFAIPLIWCCGSGLITAMVYWFLAQGKALTPFLNNQETKLRK